MTWYLGKHRDKLTKMKELEHKLILT